MYCDGCRAVGCILPYSLQFMVINEPAVCPVSVCMRNNSGIATAVTSNNVSALQAVIHIIHFEMFIVILSH